MEQGVLKRKLEDGITSKLKASQQDEISHSQQEIRRKKHPLRIQSLYIHSSHTFIHYFCKSSSLH